MASLLESAHWWQLGQALFSAHMSFSDLVDSPQQLISLQNGALVSGLPAVNSPPAGCTHGRFFSPSIHLKLTHECFQDLCLCLCLVLCVSVPESLSMCVCLSSSLFLSPSLCLSVCLCIWCHIVLATESTHCQRSFTVNIHSAERPHICIHVLMNRNPALGADLARVCTSQH